MFVLVAGTTETARIDGISAAGADPEAMTATPAADAEILSAGEPAGQRAVPVSPTGCPTPALVTRAARETVGFDVRVIDAGTSVEPAVRTTTVTTQPGGDVREGDPVPDAGAIWERAREIGASLSTDTVRVAETIPGGTTTALGVASALGLDLAVSSSLPDNPLDRKRTVVRQGLANSEIESGALAGAPREAVRRQGDPVLAAVAGMVQGATETDTAVRLAGGTQLLAAGALLRHAGVDAPLELVTTSYVAHDPSANVPDIVDSLDLRLDVIEPGFEDCGHAGLARFGAGEGKEGVGMGGALGLAREQGVPLSTVRNRAAALYDRLLEDH